MPLPKRAIKAMAKIQIEWMMMVVRLFFTLIIVLRLISEVFKPIIHCGSNPPTEIM